MSSQKPTRRDGGQHDDYVEEHPAYGMIGASRVSSTPGAALFGSDFRHQHYMTIRIYEGQARRGLSHDWYGAKGEYIEVALSEAQWATFVSAPNMGHGVPCTIQFLRGEGQLPSIQPLDDRRAQFNAEIQETLQETLASMEAVRDAAPNKKVREAAEKAIQNLRANLPFVARSFDEHAENTIEKAKIEVAAYITNAVTRAGLKALGVEGESSMLQLAGGDD